MKTLWVIYTQTAITGQGIVHSWCHVESPGSYECPRLKEWQSQEDAIKTAMAHAKANGFQRILVRKMGSAEIEKDMPVS